MKERVWLMDKHRVVEWFYYEDINFLEYVKEVKNNFTEISITLDDDNDIIIEIVKY